MSTAQSLFIAYGVLALTYGLLLGIPLAAVRIKSASASRHLVTTHLSGLMQGPIHIALAFAVGSVAFDGSLSTVAAALMVAGSACELSGGTANWLRGTEDQFAQRSMGFMLNSMSGLLIVPGILIIAANVVGRLWPGV